MEPLDLTKASPIQFNESSTAKLSDTVYFQDFTLDTPAWLLYRRDSSAKSDCAPLHTGQKELDSGGRLSRFRGGWRTGVTYGFCITGAIFMINLAVFLWLFASNYSDSRLGFITVYDGTYKTMNSISTWAHVAVNVLASLLLGVSNNAMQCLTSPTRWEIDRAHATKRWLEIGVPSFRNLKFISRQRLLLWICLGLSSVPLHFLSNSVISTSVSTNSFIAVHVSETFIDGGTWNLTGFPNSALWTSPEPSRNGPGLTPEYLAKVEDQIKKLQTAIPTLQRLEPDLCNKTYNIPFTSEWGNLLVVSSVANYSTLSSVHDITLHISGVWLPNSVAICPVNQLCISIGGTLLPTSYPVEYCLVQAQVPHCQVFISSSLLLAILICNAIKLGSLFILLKLPDFEPCVTVGDAITSFLINSDSWTLDCGALAADEVCCKRPLNRSSLCSDLSGIKSMRKAWNPRHQIWFPKTGGLRYYLALVLFILIWLASLISLLVYLYIAVWPSWSSTWAFGLDNISEDHLVPKTATTPLVAAILAINAPQLSLSIVYIFVNGLITSIILAAECSDFALARKGLRVSNPRGSQRSTYYLQIPYRYAIPLIVVSAGLHWLLSETIYLVRVATYDIDEELLPLGDLSIISYGCSGLGLILFISLSGLMILALCFFCFRRYIPRMPVVSSCSLAISAACHPPQIREDMAFQPLMYGVTGLNENGTKHVSFSSEEVEPLAVGEIYV